MEKEKPKINYEQETFGMITKDLRLWRTRDGIFFDPLKFDLVESKKSLKTDVFGNCTCLFIPIKK